METKTTEERLNWCEEYISILLKQKDEIREQINKLREAINQIHTQEIERKNK